MPYSLAEAAHRIEPEHHPARHQERPHQRAAGRLRGVVGRAGRASRGVLGRAQGGAAARIAYCLAATDALVAGLRDQLAEIGAQRDAWQGVAERLALGPRKPDAKPVTWWRWLRTAG
jgi:hypothetical protein